jgi:DNA-binding MarR family transcriptional regulator
MKPTTEQCMDELRIAGGQCAEIAARLDLDCQPVAKALHKLAKKKRIKRERMDCARKVFFYRINEEGCCA